MCFELGADLHDAAFDIFSQESERGGLEQSQPALMKACQTQWQTDDDGCMGGYTVRDGCRLCSNEKSNNNKKPLTILFAH